MRSLASRCALAIAAGAAAAALGGCAPALDWRDVRPTGSGALLLMPCKPDAQQRGVALAGPPVRLTLAACSAGGMTWALAYADVADPVRVGAALDALRAAAAANLDATATGPAAASTVPGATPQPQAGRWRLAGRLPDGKPVQMQVSVFARGTQVFQASVLGAAVGDELAAGFFESIRFDR